MLCKCGCGKDAGVYESYNYKACKKLPREFVATCPTFRLI